MRALALGVSRVQLRDILRSALGSTLFRSAGIYTLSRIINAAIPFLMMPVLTRYLTPTDYGIVAMFSVLVGMVTPFVGLSLHGAVSVRYFDKKERDLPRYIGNCFIILLASTIAAALVIWGFAGPISRLSAFPAQWLWTVVFMVAGQFVILLMLTLWQVENKALLYGLFQNLQTLLNIGLSLVLVVALGKNWQGRIEAQMVTIGLFAAIALFILFKNKRLKFAYDAGAIKHALHFGLPLIPHALGGLMIMQTDRVFLTNMVGVATAGIYSVAYQFGSIIELGASSFNQAYSPWLYRQLSEITQEKKVRIVKLTYLYFVVILAIALLLSVFVPWFLTFFVGPKFLGAQAYIFWITLGFAFSGMYYMVANYIFFAAKTAVLAWVTFTAALVNVGLNYLFIKMNGPVGAAQASMLTFFLSFVMTWVLSSRAYPMPWNLLRKGVGEEVVPQRGEGWDTHPHPGPPLEGEGDL